MLAYAGDLELRDRELSRLLTQIAQAQGVVQYADGRVEATIRYTQPLLQSASAPERVRRGLAELVAEEAAGQLRPVTEARTQVAQIRALPWHGAVRDARRRYVAYLDARLDLLRAAADDGRVLLRPRPQVDAALAVAERALRTAGADPAAVRSALTPSRS